MVIVDAFPVAYQNVFNVQNNTVWYLIDGHGHEVIQEETSL